MMRPLPFQPHPPQPHDRQVKHNPSLTSLPPHSGQEQKLLFSAVAGTPPHPVLPDLFMISSILYSLSTYNKNTAHLCSCQAIFSDFFEKSNPKPHIGSKAILRHNIWDILIVFKTWNRAAAVSS
jgi:hypothetical protein